MPCPACGCPANAPAHAVSTALQADDLDAAIDAGLLEVDPCPDCGDACSTVLRDARDERRHALAARERFRARSERLARRTEERQRKRLEAQSKPAALPAAAAAALARALARAGKPR